MRLGIMLGYSGATMRVPLELIREADKLGVYAVWTAEAYGSDAVTPLAWLAAQTEQIRLGTAIMQMPGRTPANTAMTAMTLDQLSGGRFLLGLGVSGPQVIEGWHGQPYPRRILGYTREYVTIVRHILERRAPLTHAGDYFHIPYAGPEGLGLGKPLKSILHGRTDLPIYIAAIGPKNVQQTAAIADGWLPIFFAPERYAEVFAPPIEAGLSEAGKGHEQFDIAAPVSVIISDDMEAGYNALKPSLALYIGGMGAKKRNFYYNLACRYGFEQAADAIQAHYLDGRRAEAIAAVPDALVDMVALVGPPARIADRFQLWRSAPITTLNLVNPTIEALRLMVELVNG